MAVTTKMSVDVSGFTTGIRQAQNSVKTLDAELKKNEAQYKATGNSEQYMAEKSRILQQKLNEQKTAAANAEKALKAMTDGGLTPADAEYQKMERTLLNAQAAMFTTQDAMNQLGSGALNASKSADQLADSVNSINKKVSLDSVIQGIGSITSALESAASKAVSLGQSIWDDIMDSARWADDAATMAQMYEIPLDTYLRMQKMVDEGMDTSVDAMLGAQTKLRKGIGKESKETIDTLKELGLVVTEAGGKTADTFDKMLYSDPEEMFWAAGQAIMNLGDAFDKEAAAQAVFGKSWRELIPLFTEFSSKEEYNKALEGMNVNSEQAVEDLAALNDAMAKLESDFKVLKQEVLAGLAPALTEAANALSTLLQEVQAYLKTEEGQQALQDMRDAVSGLFSDLSKIDPEQVVEGFKKVFDGIVKGIQWLVEHKQDVVDALKWIVAGWATLKLTGGALRLYNLVVGLKGLGVGAGASAGAAGVGQVAGGAAAAGGHAGLSAALSTLAVPVAGLAITGATVYLSGKIIADLNDSANKAREVKGDENRYANLSNEEKAYLQSTVRAIQHEEGGSEKVAPALQQLAEKLGPNLLDIFEYENTSGQKRNKLVDMLEMDNESAAIAAMMMQAAGIDTSRFGTAFDNALGLWNAFQRDGKKSYTGAYTTLAGPGGFWDLSGTFVNGKFTIPGYEEYKRVMSGTPSVVPNPWELSGYANTTNKPTSMRNWKTGYWVNGEWRDGAFKDVEIGPGTWNPEDHEDVSQAADAMNNAAEVMKQLPASVSEAMRSVPLTVQLSLFPKANGMAYVPYDGYLASLHRGERIVPARENMSANNYNSNLYVESMIMNNGTDAAGLAASMAAAQRRTMTGFGS